MNLRSFWGAARMVVAVAGLGGVGCGPAFESAGGDGGPEAPETAGDAQPDKVGVFPDAGVDMGNDTDADAGAEAEANAEAGAEAEAEAEAPDAPSPCVPDTCEAHGYLCGSIDDGCGHTVYCGHDWERYAGMDPVCAGMAAYSCSYLDPKDMSHAVLGTGPYPHPWCTLSSQPGGWVICC